MKARLGRHCGYSIRAMMTLPDGSDVGFRIVNGTLDPAETSHLLRTLEASPLTRPRDNGGALSPLRRPCSSAIATREARFAPIPIATLIVVVNAPYET